MKLYPDERKAIKIIASIQDRGRKSFTLDEFADLFYNGKPRTISWRSTINARLARIGRKLDEAEGQCRLSRTSGLGRGAVATYTAQGYFRSLLKTF